MNQIQQQARDRAVQSLERFLAPLAGSATPPSTIAEIVDDIILASTLPAPADTMHAETVRQVRGPDPRD